MTGSEKQIMWAEKIRVEIASKLESVIEGRNSEITERNRKMATYILGIDDARFWIDHRNWDALRLLEWMRTCGLQINGTSSTRRAMFKNGEIVVVEHS